MKKYSVSDSQLVSLYKKGNEEAFEKLVNRHKAKIYTAILLIVKDRYTAEDLMQETFIKVVNTIKSGRYNEEGKFQQWALRIAYNLCVDFFRKNKRRPIVSTSEDFDIFEVVNLSEDSEESRIMKKQTYDKIRQLVNLLPHEQREVIILRHYAELSFKEIAELTNVSINTALGRMRYALINIRKMITEKQISLQ
jgi:RNA polymerase sigma-70 factor (ECF subfamily)